MILLALLFLCVCIIYLEMGIYAISLNPKSLLNRLFLILCIFFSIWSFDNVLFNIIKEKDKMMFFHSMFAFSWCIYPGISLHLALILTKKNNLLKKWLIYPAIYLPGLLFTIQEIVKDRIVSDFIPYQYGWKAIYDLNSAWYWSYQIYYFMYVFIAIVIAGLWGRKSPSLREKKQTRIIILCTSISLFLAFTIDSLLPNLNIRFLPPLNTFFILIWCYGIWYAIVKYKLMYLTPEIATEEIISKMMDLLFFINPETSITRINKQAEILLGYKDSELYNTSIIDLLKDKQLFSGEFIKMKSLKNYEIKQENYLKTKGGGLIPVEILCSALKDEAGEILGAVVVVHDLIQMKQLIKEVQERKKAEEDLTKALINLKTRNDIMENDLFMARKIQQQFIPSVSPAPNIAFYYKPTESVGGDFYDFIKFDEPDKYGIFLSDVSGHGVPAAFITSMIKSFLLQAGGIKNDPAELLKNLNDHLRGQVGGNFITAFYGVFDEADKSMLYASAGHNSPYIITGNSITVLETKYKGIPLAILSDPEMSNINKIYKNNSIRFEKGSKIILYTDGIIEAVNINNDVINFEDNSIIDVFLSFKELKPKDFVLNVYMRLVEFRGSDKFEDDICLICAQC